MKPFLIAASFISLLLATGAAAADSSRLDFEVFLDAKPVGTHRFEIEKSGDEVRRVTSNASFQVRIFGIPAYRYRHEATEKWEGGCLKNIESATDDNGEREKVSRTLQYGCISSYAYWNPEVLLRQQSLLNPQTGATDAVRIESIGEEGITVRGQSVRASHHRLTSDKFVIDLWYSKQGEWLQLESTTTTKRKLRYRLATAR